MNPERHADTDLDTAVRHPEAIAHMWAGLLLAPAAFMTGLTVSYALSSPGCGQRHDLILHAVHATVLLIGCVGLMLAWLAQRPRHSDDPPAVLGRGGLFLARVGMGTSALFVAAMIVQWVPSFVYASCR